MDKDVDELISSLEKILNYNCFVFNLSWHLYPKTLCPMDKDQKFKDQVRLAASEFEEVMRDYLSKEDFLRNADLESLKDLRSSHKLAEHNIETKIEQHYEFDGLYRYFGNAITVSEFLQKVTSHFRSYKPPELPVVNACPATKEVRIKSSDLIIFEMTSNLTRKYLTSKITHKPLHVKELLRILKERNMRIGDIFLFFIHDGPQNNYQLEYSKHSIEEIDTSETVKKKLYYPGFFYVKFEAICKLWLDNSPQEYKMLKALKKSRAQTQKHQAQNREKEAENKKLVEQTKKLTKKLAKQKEQIAKKEEQLAKKDKQLLANQNVIVDEMRQKMLEEMRRQASFNSYGQKEERKLKLLVDKQSSSSKSSFPSANESFEESEIPTTTETSRRQNKGRSRRKKGRQLRQDRKKSDLSSSFENPFSADEESKNLPGAKTGNRQNKEQKRGKKRRQIPQELELKESDFNMAYEESQLGKISNSSSPSSSPTKKTKQH